MWTEQDEAARRARWEDGAADPDKPFGEGPWEIRWAVNTGLHGIDRVRTAARAAAFLDDMLRRASEGGYEIVRINVRNIDTGEKLPTGPLADLSLAKALKLGEDELMGGKTCGTCNGSGKIHIIQTGEDKDCTRCNGTGKE